MRYRLFLTMVLVAMPMCMVGCESQSGTTVGTGSGEPPPDVKKQIEENAKRYELMQKETSKIPTPSDGRGGGAPPAGG